MPSAPRQFMPAAERERRARSFGDVAGEYDRGRPGYPAQAIGWALGTEPLHVLDVGAGTGKLTAALLAAGHRVSAVEPLPEMRAVLQSQLPAALALDGTAEQLPVADRSVDAVVVGAAFHWFDHERALAEIGRVLREPGVLALLGNSFDTSLQWERELREILGPATLGRPGHWPEPERLALMFADVDDAEFPHRQSITLGQLRDYASSRSAFAVMDAGERGRRLDLIDRLWEGAPEIDGRPRADLAWLARVRRCRGLR